AVMPLRLNDQYRSMGYCHALVILVWPSLTRGNATDRGPVRGMGWCHLQQHAKILLGHFYPWMNEAGHVTSYPLSSPYTRAYREYGVRLSDAVVGNLIAARRSPLHPRILPGSQ